MEAPNTFFGFPLSFRVEEKDIIPMEIQGEKRSSFYDYAPTIGAVLLGGSAYWVTKDGLQNQPTNVNLRGLSAKNLVTQIRMRDMESSLKNEFNVKEGGNRTTPTVQKLSDTPKPQIHEKSETPDSEDPTNSDAQSEPADDEVNDNIIDKSFDWKKHEADNRDQLGKNTKEFLNIRKQLSKSDPSVHNSDTGWDYLMELNFTLYKLFKVEGCLQKKDHFSKDFKLDMDRPMPMCPSLCKWTEMLFKRFAGKSVSEPVSLRADTRLQDPLGMASSLREAMSCILAIENQMERNQEKAYKAYAEAESQVDPLVNAGYFKKSEDNESTPRSLRRKLAAACLISNLLGPDDVRFFEFNGRNQNEMKLFLKHPQTQEKHAFIVMDTQIKKGESLSLPTMSGFNAAAAIYVPTALFLSEEAKTKEGELLYEIKDVAQDGNYYDKEMVLCRKSTESSVPKKLTVQDLMVEASTSNNKVGHIFLWLKKGDNTRARGANF